MHLIDYARSEDVIGLEAQEAPQISAKTGLNIEEVLAADNSSQGINCPAPK